MTRTLPALLTFPEIRRRLDNGWGWRLAAGIAAGFAFLSMLAGGMLILEDVQGSYTVQLLSAPGASNWWDFPELLAVQPWGYVVLPLLPTIAMGVVAAGAGIGTAVAVTVVAPLVMRRTRTDAHSLGGIAAGASPGLAGFAALGACCCTGCTTSAGVAVVAAASGTSFATLTLNDWYLGSFQIIVVFVSLLVQERALGLRATPALNAPVRTVHLLSTGALRLALLVAALTWSLAMFVEWASETSPLAATAPVWYHWLFEHQLLCAIGLAAALFPGETVRWLERRANSVSVGLLRIAVVVAGVTWGIGVPPVAVSAGLGGFVNEVLGVLGFPERWGGVPPDAAVGAPLLFHWLFQHLLLGGLAIAFGLAPLRVFRFLAPGASRAETDGTAPQPAAPVDEDPSAGGEARA